jgi:thioredoxin-related protein
MRLLLISVLISLGFTSSLWETDLTKAKATAKAENKMILLNFSGSDWCGPCIRLHKEIFDSQEFSSYASEHLILVKADFPRLKKNQLSKEQLQKNNALAEKYNKEGDFPLTLLLTSDGKVVKSWQGYPSTSPLEFTNQVKEIVDANK